MARALAGAVGSAYERHQPVARRSVVAEIEIDDRHRAFHGDAIRRAQAQSIGGCKALRMADSASFN